MNLKHFHFKHALLGFGLATAAILPISVALSCAKPTDNTIKVDGKRFSSVQEVTKYLEQTAERRDASANSALYQITEGANKTTYDDFGNLTTAVESKYLRESKAYLPKKALDEHNGNVLRGSTPEFVTNGRLHSNVPVSNDQAATRLIYRTANGKYVFDHAAAKESYIQVHNGFTFNGMYFENASAVEDYLNNDYELSKDLNNNYYFVQDEFGNSSQNLALNSTGSAPTALKLNKNDLNTTQNMREFVNNYAETYVRNASGESVKLSEFTASSLSDESVPVFNLDNTSGKTSYTIDLTSKQEGSLFGPQVLTTAYSPVNRITQADSWERSSSKMSDLKAFTDFRQLLFTQFINLQLTGRNQVDSFADIIFQDPREFDPSYATWLEKNPNFVNQNIGSDFFARLNSFSLTKTYPFNFSETRKTLRQGLNYVEDILYKGQNYGFLNAISILRSWALNELINNGAKTSELMLINDAFDNATYYLNYLVHEGVDQYVSAAAQKFNFADVFNFAESRTFGEDPSVYISRLEAGIINNKIVPEATEIILAVPYASLLVLLASDFKKERLNFPNENPYPLPDSLDSIDWYLQLQRKRLADRGEADTPSLKLYEWIKKSMEIFKEADSGLKGRQALSTLRVSSDAFVHLEAQINKYFQFLSLYWLNIDASKLDTLYTQHDGVGENDGVADRFNWDRASKSEFADRTFRVLSTANPLLKETILAQYRKFASSDSFAFKAINTFNIVGNTLRGMDNNVIKNGEAVGAQIAKSYTAFRNFSKIATKAIVAVMVLDIAVQMVMGFIGTQEDTTYSYTHNRGEATYYWNGGSVRKHSVFGFEWESGVKKLNDDDILTPIVIRSETTQNAYYYVGDFEQNNARTNMYRSLADAKTAYINDLRNYAVNREVSNTTFEYGITLVKNGSSKTFKARTISSLTNKILDEEGDFINQRTSLFGKIYNADANGKQAAIDALLAVIRANPLWIVQMPSYIDGKLTKSDYAIPASEHMPLYAYYDKRKWLTDKNGAKEQSAFLQKQALETLQSIDAAKQIDREKLYLQYDTETIKAALPRGTAVNGRTVIENVLTQFDKRFIVPQKWVLLSSLYHNNESNDFDAIPTLEWENGAAKATPVFVVTTAIGEQETFLDRGIALQFLLGKLSFTRLNWAAGSSLYFYRNTTFNSISEIVAWVLKLPENARRG